MTIDLKSLPYNPGYGWYQTETDIRGSSVVVYVSGRGGDGVDALSARVNAAVEWIEYHMEDVLAYSSSALLASKNDDWVDDEHPAVTAEEFERRLRLGAVRFHPDGEIELTSRDGGLFWGHWVVVWMNADNQFTKAYLSG